MVVERLIEGNILKATVHSQKSLLCCTYYKKKFKTLIKNDFYSKLKHILTVKVLYEKEYI